MRENQEGHQHFAIDFFQNLKVAAHGWSYAKFSQTNSISIVHQLILENQSIN